MYRVHVFFSNIIHNYYDTIKRDKYINNNEYKRELRDKVGKNILNKKTRENIM